MPEVVVVGGGLAGCWAAVTAARAGLQVALVRRGPAATAVSSGALDPALPGVDESVAGDLDDATLARAVEASGGAEMLGEAIASALGGEAVDVVLLPAVLGLDDPDGVRARVESVAGVRVAELLSPPPSAPGWRLARAAEAMARRAGVEIVTGSVAGIRRAERRVVAVEAAGGDTLSCEVLVLATGKYLGGGLTGDRRPREPLLGLPLFTGGVAVDTLGPRDLVERTRFGPQPFLAAGVRTDAEGRPVDGFGAPVLDNLLACGALLAAVDTTLRGGGLGVATWTGARAGRSAARLRGVAAA